MADTYLGKLYDINSDIVETSQYLFDKGLVISDQLQVLHFLYEYPPPPTI